MAKKISKKERAEIVQFLYKVDAEGALYACQNYYPETGKIEDPVISRLLDAAEALAEAGDEFEKALRDMPEEYVDYSFEEDE